MRIRVNLTKEFSEGEVVTLNGKKKGIVLFNNCNGTNNLLIEDEDGNIFYQNKDNIIGKNLKGSESTITNYISKYLNNGDIIRLDCAGLFQIVKSIIQIEEITIDNYDYKIFYLRRYDIDIDGNMINIRNSEYDNKLLYLYNVRRISFANEEEINILNNL